jgi:putative endonuclease
MYSDKRKFGNMGEEAASMFLEKHGFKILDRNYLRKWGEIDIVAEKAGVIHFLEVKSSANVSDETGYRPEENVHPQKLKRLARAMQTYVLEKKIDADWQLDIAVVRIDQAKRQAHVELIENIVI